MFQNNYIEKIQDWEYEVKIKVDSRIFSIDVTLKAAYELADKVFMSFDSDDDYFYVSFRLKSLDSKIEDIVDWFWEELVFHRLRDNINDKVWEMRYKIIETALGFWLNINDIREDIQNITQKLWKVITTNQSQPQLGQGKVQINDKKSSIDDIIDDISNDPAFADEKDDIIWILKQLEQK